MNKSVVEELFTERFRPKDFNSLIIPPRVKNELSKGLVQNLLLYGTPGTGKTSALKIISANHPTLWINASSDASIDTLRNTIEKFCSTISLEGGKERLKCVVLDEIDGAKTDFFRAFRGTIEKYASVARFIASCNYIEKLDDSIQSRFNCISFNPINSTEEEYLISQYKERVGRILTAIKVTYTDEILHKFVHNYFPDLRSLMNRIQSFYLQGIRELDHTNFNINFQFEDLYKLCLEENSKPYENYKFITSEYSSKVDEAIAAINGDFFEYVKQYKPTAISKMPQVIITAAEHQHQAQFVIDKMITLLSLVFKIQLILSTK